MTATTPNEFNQVVAKVAAALGIPEGALARFANEVRAHHEAAEYGVYSFLAPTALIQATVTDAAQVKVKIKPQAE